MIADPILLGLVAAGGGIGGVLVKEGLKFILVINRRKQVAIDSAVTNKMKLLVYEHSQACPLPQLVTALTKDMATKGDVNSLADMIRSQTERWDAHLTFHMERNNLYGGKE